MRTIVWGSVIALCAAVCSVSSASAFQATTRQATTNDGIYSKAQAEAAKPKFEKLCSECHAFTLAARKHEKDLLLGDEPFLKKWEGRSLDELLTVIVTTMPNDGSAVISDEEALNLLAYVLQQNGFAPGKAPLDKAAGAAVLARPVKK
ncbi:MAG TPA: c-type cytochrome [Vicinamibacterales bacterium]|nr:c-type cytochrome [Vicinamibacterales bacterium]